MKCFLRACSMGLSVLFGVVAAQAQTGASDSIFGDQGGLDHVVIAVHDLPSAMQDFEELGFITKAGGHFPGGVHNSLIFLENHEYLELIAVDNSEPKDSDSNDVLNFLKQGDGAMFLGLRVSSAKRAYEELVAHNFDVTNPDPGSVAKEGESQPPPPMWYEFGPPPKPDPGKRSFPLPIFFIQYLDKSHQDKSDADAGKKSEAEKSVKPPVHPNSAQRVHAVWFALKDSKAAISTMTSGGFVPTDTPMKFLHSSGQGLQAGEGQMVLLNSAKKHSEVAKYVVTRGDSVIGLSIEVSNLEAVQKKIEDHAKRRFHVYQGSFGRSLLVPPQYTHGVWMEFFQK